MPTYQVLKIIRAYCEHLGITYESFDTGCDHYEVLIDGKPFSADWKHFSPHTLDRLAELVGPHLNIHCGVKYKKEITIGWWSINWMKFELND